MAASKASFNWEDPLLLDQQLTEEERMVRDSARQYCQDKLMPRVLNSFRNEQTDVEIFREMGELGLLGATIPEAYGGAGMNYVCYGLIAREVERVDSGYRSAMSVQSSLVMYPIEAYGSEEQKQFFLKLIFRGEVRTWQLLSEPEAGSDLANVKTTAIRDGDDYVINGQKVFVGSGLGCDYMWTITVTDTEAKRHENLGWFMIKADLPGITIQPMDLLISGGESGAGSGVKNTVFFDNVRVPAFNLIGGENQGWKVATTHLELEHGTGGRISRNWLVDRMFEYCQTTQRRGQPMSKDPEVRDRLVDIYIEAEITRLFNLRNYWMRHSKVRMTYEGPQTSYFRKTSGLRMAGAILDILGPSALTYDSKWGAAEGHMEAHQRSAIVALHPGGTADIQKVIMARRIGIGREVREQAGALA